MESARERKKKERQRERGKYRVKETYKENRYREKNDIETKETQGVVQKCYFCISFLLFDVYALVKQNNWYMFKIFILYIMKVWLSLCNFSTEFSFFYPNKWQFEHNQSIHAPPWLFHQMVSYIVLCTNDNSFCPIIVETHLDVSECLEEIERWKG